MINKRAKDRVRDATVKLLGKGGQGVLVHGGLIVTAAHCINWKSEGEMVLGDDFLEPVETRKGQITGCPLAVEPVSDIAVLGAPDPQELAEYSMQFEKFCENTEAVPICTEEFPLFESIPVHVFTHRGRWVKGTAEQCREEAVSLAITPERRICGGTSGSPIVNDAGQLVAIVSNSWEKARFAGPQPRPHLALPVWILRMIEKAQDAGRPL